MPDPIADFINNNEGSDWLSICLLLCKGDAPGEPLNDDLISEFHQRARDGDWFAYEVLDWLLLDVAKNGQPPSPALTAFAKAVRVGNIHKPVRTKANPERDWRIATVANDLVLWDRLSRQEAIGKIADALDVDDSTVQRAIGRGGGWGKGWDCRERKVNGCTLMVRIGCSFS